MKKFMHLRRDSSNL